MNDLISRQAAIDVLNVLCQEHRYKIPGKGETYSQYNEAWQDALDRAEGAIGNLPPAQSEIIRCKDCKWYREGTLLPPNKFCYRLKDNSGKRIGYNFADDDFCSHAERRTDE